MADLRVPPGVVHFLAAEYQHLPVVIRIIALDTVHPDIVIGDDDEIQTGAYGFTLGGAMGMGFVENEDGATADFINSGTYEIDIAGVRYPAKASLRPMYDPKGIRVRS